MTQPFLKFPTFGELKELLTAKYGCTVELQHETFDGNSMDFFLVERPGSGYCTMDIMDDSDLVAPGVIRTVCLALAIDIDGMWLDIAALNRAAT